MVLLVDNFDSFSYNLADYVMQCGEAVEVIRNNTSPDALQGKVFTSVILSPGPQTPGKAGQLMGLIDYYIHQLPVLGICLGHQAIGEYFGAKLVRAQKPMHGKISKVYWQSDLLVDHLPSAFEVVRYHSLVLEQLPSCLEAVAWTEKEEIMALRHRNLPIRGVQFHPEAALTEYGLEIIRNWLNFVRMLR